LTIPRPLRRTAFTATALAATSACAIAFSGCGEERSPDAYCRAFYTKAAPIRQGYVQADQNMQSDPLNGLVKLLSAPGDLESIFDGMVDHAPDDIKSDTVKVRDSLKDMQSNMGKALSDPKGAIGGLIVGSLTSAGAWQRVDDYLNQHCPVNSPIAQKAIRDSESQ
jgi:hypothetical protein